MYLSDNFIVGFFELIIMPVLIDKEVLSERLKEFSQLAQLKGRKSSCQKINVFFSSFLWKKM